MKTMKTSLKFSMRMGTFITSVSLRKNICSLWLLLSQEKTKNQTDQLNLLLSFCYLALDKWKGDTAKGFSDFITQRMIKDILDSKDYIEYKRIYKDL